jgi:hypothetical protein
MGLLTGGIAAIFGSALSGLYPDGILHREGVEPQYDLEGNVTGYAGGADVPIKVQRDACSYSMRQSEGYSDGDVMLIILAAQLGGVKVTTDMQATDGAGDRWMIGSADLDAASSHWILRGRAA